MDSSLLKEVMTRHIALPDAVVSVVVAVEASAEPPAVAVSLTATVAPTELE